MFRSLPIYQIQNFKVSSTSNKTIPLNKKNTRLTNITPSSNFSSSLPTPMYTTSTTYSSSSSSLTLVQTQTGNSTTTNNYQTPATARNIKPTTTAEHEIRLNHTTGLPLRNTTPYGRHSNDWLFGSVEVHKSIARRIKKAIPHHSNRPSAAETS